MDTLNQGKGRKLIVPSPTRWEEDHDAIIRFLEVRIDFESFLRTDERLEKDTIQFNCFTHLPGLAPKVPPQSNRGSWV